MNEAQHGDSLSTLLELLTAGSQPRFASGFDDPLVQEVIASFRREISELEQLILTARDGEE